MPFLANKKIISNPFKVAACGPNTQGDKLKNEGRERVKIL